MVIQFMQIDIQMAERLKYIFLMWHIVQKPEQSSIMEWDKRNLIVPGSEAEEKEDTICLCV